MGEFVEINLVIGVALFNYFFFRMWHILRGKWWRFSPIWKWSGDIAELKNLSKTAESERLRQASNTTLWGLYFTAGYLLFFGILGYILTKLGYYYNF